MSVNPEVPHDWSPDGRFILYGEVDPKTGPDLWILPLFADRKPFVFLQTPFSEVQGPLFTKWEMGRLQLERIGNSSDLCAAFSAGGRSVDGINERWQPTEMERNGKGTVLHWPGQKTNGCRINRRWQQLHSRQSEAPV